jgi:hypothetical protein
MIGVSKTKFGSFGQIQQSKMSPILANNKIAIVAQGGDGGDGHSGLSQQPTMKLTTPMDTVVL